MAPAGPPSSATGRGSDVPSTTARTLSTEPISITDDGRSTGKELEALTLLTHFGQPIKQVDKIYSWLIIFIKRGNTPTRPIGDACHHFY